MSDPKITTWSTPESPIAIEYSLVVIEEIRQVVAEGFQRLSRGGIEVGGVLYGTREGRTIRVLAIRQVNCEHARGPSFVLSEKDLASLQEQLVQDQADPRLEGMIPLGWFVSHTRSEIALNDADLDLYETFFPAAWQVTLVIRPGRGGTMRAGFFVRQEDGSVKSDRSYLDFNFPDRLAGVLDRPPRDRGADRAASGDRRMSNYPRLANPAVGGEPLAGPDPLRRDVPPFAAAPELLAPRFDVEAPRRKWLWPVAWCVLAVAVAALGLRLFLVRPGVEPIALSVAERDDQLQIGWNNSSTPVKDAARGTLEIIDGKAPRTIALTAQDLAQGKFTYVRKSGDVQVRLTVENGSGQKTEEASRFLGSPPATPADDSEVTALKQRRDELEAEVLGLRQENEQQAGRIQQLERTLLILRSRVGADPGR